MTAMLTIMFNINPRARHQEYSKYQRRSWPLAGGLGVPLLSCPVGSVRNVKIRREFFRRGGKTARQPLMTNSPGPDRSEPSNPPTPLQSIADVQSIHLSSILMSQFMPNVTTVVFDCLHYYVRQRFQASTNRFFTNNCRFYGYNQTKLCRLP